MRGYPSTPKAKAEEDKEKMAIYHFSIKNIGRSNGRSAVAAAAYRSGEKLIDSVYGKEQDYTRKQALNMKIFMHRHMPMKTY